MYCWLLFLAVLLSPLSALADRDDSAVMLEFMPAQARVLSRLSATEARESVLGGATLGVHYGLTHSLAVGGRWGARGSTARPTRTSLWKPDASELATPWVDML